MRMAGMSMNFLCADVFNKHGDSELPIGMRRDTMPSWRSDELTHGTCAGVDLSVLLSNLHSTTHLPFRLLPALFKFLRCTRRPT